MAHAIISSMNTCMDYLDNSPIRALSDIQRGTGINGSKGDYPYSEFTVTNANGDNVLFNGSYQGGSTSRVDTRVIRRWEHLFLTKVSEQGNLQVTEYKLDKFSNAQSDRGRGAGSNASLTVLAP